MRRGVATYGWKWYRVCQVVARTGVVWEVAPCWAADSVGAGASAWDRPCTQAAEALAQPLVRLGGAVPCTRIAQHAAGIVLSVTTIQIFGRAPIALLVC